MATNQTLINVQEGDARELAAAPASNRKRNAAIAAVGGVALACCVYAAAPALAKLQSEQPHSPSLHDLLATELEAMFPRELPDPKVDIKCFIEHCSKEFGMCAAKSVVGDTCIKTMQCEQGCNDLEKKEGHNRSPGCAYLCEMTTGYKSAAFTDLMNCGKNNKCLPMYPDDGECLATDKDALQNITSLDQVAGDWWVVKGMNCGQVTDGTPFHPEWGVPQLNPTPGKNFPGGYDWYPCQHENFVKSEGKKFEFPVSEWVNNITYCGGANGGLKQCTTDIIDTVANVTMCAPGVVCHNYTDAPLKPQFEHWRIISWPHPDWMFTIWCGGTPLLKYNGGITLSKHRSVEGMPKWVEENFRQTAKRFNVDWDQMCPSDNKDCP